MTPSPSTGQDELVAELSAINEESMYHAPASTKKIIDRAIDRIESLTAEKAKLEERVRLLCGLINEARVHLSDLTDKGLGSIDNADQVLLAALNGEQK